MSLRNLVLFGVLLTLMLVPLRAQTFGEITGTVMDSTGAIVVGAIVRITNVSTNQVREVQTNETGNYTAPFLVPGRYDVQAESPGFKQMARNGVGLEVGAVARINFSMELGVVSEQVSVSGGAPLLNTESTAVGTVIENKRIVELPLNGRNYTQLIALSPNVAAEMRAGGKGAQRQGGERTSQTFSIAGQRLVFNHFTLDGTENTDVNFNTFIIRPSIDAVQEFKVQTGVYSAEFGRASSQINVTTKPGSNQFHGTLFEFLRNNKLDAKEWKKSGEKNPFRRNQFGFTFAGPLVHDRLFFMSNFEGLRERKTLLGLANVPPPRMRGGDFSGQPRGIYDPLTRVFGADATGNIKALSASRFLNDTIPETRFNPVSLQLLEFYPLPTQNQGDNILSNHVRQRSRPINWDQFVQRIDFGENANSNWFGRFSWGKESVQNLQAFETDEGRNLTKVYQAMLSNTRVLSPTVVNELRFGYNQFQNDQLPHFAGERNVTGELPIVGPSVLPEVAWGVPFMQFENGLTNFGQDGNSPFINRNHTFQLMDNLAVIRGNHSLRFGGEVRRDRYNQIGNEHSRGSYQFQSKATFNPLARSSTGHSYADYLLGEVRFTALTLGLADAMYRATSTAVYAEDSWKITPRLTMNIGLRHEYMPPWHDKYRGFANLEMFGILPGSPTPILTRPGEGDFYEGLRFRFADGIPVRAGDQYLGRRTVFPDRNDFAPRLGFAYSPTDRWTFRTGFGVFYTQDSTNPEFDKARNIQGYLQFNSDDERPNSILSAPFAEQKLPCTGWNGPCVAQPAILPTFTGRRTPYTMQWLFNVQRQLTEDVSLELGYMGNSGHKLQVQDQWNVPVAKTGPDDFRTVEQRRPWSEYGIMYPVNGIVNANYNALSVKLQQRLSRGLTYLIGYTWAKAIDMGSGIRSNEGDGGGPDPYNHDRNRGLAQYHQGHRLVASYLYELPFGAGQRFGNSPGVIDKLIGGWQLGGILTFGDGTPWPVGGIGDTRNTTLGNVPDATGLSPIPEDRSSSNFWNRAAFSSASPELIYRHGNVGRNVLFTPGLAQWDFSLLKNIAIREGHSLQFRFEAFNFGNHPNWNPPANDIRQPVTFGVVTTARTMREMQVGLKYSF